jgi:hypothetical protein
MGIRTAGESSTAAGPQLQGERPRLGRLFGEESVFGEVAKNGTRVACAPRIAADTAEKIFHDLVEFFFDDVIERNMLLSR